MRGPTGPVCQRIRESISRVMRVAAAAQDDFAQLGIRDLRGAIPSQRPGFLDELGC